MRLKFSKRNVVYLLMVLAQERSNGIFMNELVHKVKRDIDEINQKGIKANGISRATFFNYFNEIKEKSQDLKEKQDLLKASREFVTKHPRSTDKFYRQFNRYTYDIILSFLEENEYVEDTQKSRGAHFNKSSLYYSLIKFLELDQHTIETKHTEVTGDYKVYRPSLTNPGKVLVSCARIESMKDGTLHYLELMHFMNGLHWQRQILDGFVIARDGRIAFLTRDSNTKFMQFSVVYPVLREPNAEGKPIIKSMAGIYSGSSSNRRSGFFSTGIFLVRENFKYLSRYPVERWKTGLLKGYGLVDLEDVPAQVRERMIDIEP